MDDDYAKLLRDKSQIDGEHGFAPIVNAPFLFDFQHSLVEWALRKGRAAIFADCGLGKTPMQLVWGQNVVEKTSRPVLLLTPLAVGAQTIREAQKFGIDARRAEAGAINEAAIYVTNYERLHHFDREQFAGVICDESSILKSFEGTTRSEVTAFMRKIQYRLLLTATAAPNDFTELGTSSEALGYLGHQDMLSRFFKNDHNTSDSRRVWAAHGNAKPTWRFRGHAEEPFWRWVASWARSLRKPSDLGYSDERHTLPTLIEREHIVAANKPREGMLFALPAHGLAEEREERRRTLKERCERVAQLVADDQPAVVWCQLNDEGDMLQRLIADAVQVSGKDDDDEKEAKLSAFTEGKTRVLITKPVIGAWGLNWQHCAHMTTFASHSFEQYYQSVRRCWRFGQTRPVVVDLVVSDGEAGIAANLQRKAQQADKMFERIVAHMRDAQSIARNWREFGKTTEVPSWL